jgi:hypothetical protein
MKHFLEFYLLHAVFALQLHQLVHKKNALNKKKIVIQNGGDKIQKLKILNF